MPRPSAPLRSTALAVLAVALGPALAACSNTVALQPAEDANDPACAQVSARLPGQVDGQDRQWTNAQATGAWGSPTALILTCGVETPGPTTLQCVTAAGVDWIVDDTETPNLRLTTFGREPAVELFFDNEAVNNRSVLDQLSPIVSALPTTGAMCTDRPTD